jgi:putative ABC transport system permease protein
MSRWRQFFSRRKRMMEDLDQDIRDYIERETQDNVERGMSPEEARFAALRKFGNVTRVKEETWEVWSFVWLEQLWQDVCFGLRQLRRNPGFTAVAILILALGIGANTAIFSVMDAVLLRPLPFPDSHQLVLLWDSYGSKGNYAAVSYPNFLDWRAWSHSFSGMAALNGSSYVLTGQGEPVHLEGMTASASLFQVLGVQPILGRRFLLEEDQPHADNGTDAAILSYKTWKEIFQGDRKVIGRSIALDGKPFMVVGVAPQGVESQMGDPGPQFWTTAAPLAEVSPQSPKPLSEERQMSFLSVIGRLRPSVTLAQAEADMDHVAAELMKAYPKDDPEEGVIIKSMQDTVTRDVRPLLLALLAAVGVVLMVACANVAALMLARATGRQREMAVRAALGAGRGRIARQMLVESLLLAAIGGALGLWIAVMLGHTLLTLLGVTWVTQVSLDGRVLGFALLVAAGSAVIFGLAPTLRACKTDLVHGLKEGGQATSESRGLNRARKILVIGQVALAAALLSSAGLLTRSLINLERTDPGFNPTHVMTFPVSLPSQQYPQGSWPSFFGELTARLHGLPGVESASAGGALPFEGGASRTVLDNVAGRPIPQNERRGIVYVPVTPGYFRTLRIPIKVGREFTDHDTASSEPVLIINEAAARRYFGEKNPIGQRIEPMMWNGSGSKTMMRTIVGVAGDVKNYSLSQLADPTVYWPVAQIPSNNTMYVAVRTAGNPLGIMGAVRQQLHAMDKNLPLYNLWSLDHYVDQTLIQSRYNTLLLASFALLALTLTTVGLYGSMAYSVAQRIHEIGIRMALGARRGDVLRAVIRDGVLVGAAGLAIGIPVAAAATRLIRSLLYGVSPGDPLTLVLVALVLMGVALMASYIPAQRASKVDPMVALRYE